MAKKWNLNDSNNLRSNAESYLNNPVELAQYDPNGTVAKMANDLQNYKKFSYDFNADPLYQNYKDQYVQAGQMAMQDTMGNAAALSGGYGNSYAATAGNQAYQQYLTQLNNVIPELYQAAYTRYNDDRNNARANYEMMKGLADDAYSRSKDAVDLYQTNLSNAYGIYNDRLNYDYTKSVDDRNYNYQVGRDKVTDANNDRNYNLQKDQVQLEKDKFTYQKEQDSKKKIVSEAATSGSSPSNAKSETVSPGDFNDYVTRINNYQEKTGKTGLALAEYIARLNVDSQTAADLMDEFDCYYEYVQTYGDEPAFTNRKELATVLGKKENDFIDEETFKNNQWAKTKVRNGKTVGVYTTYSDYLYDMYLKYK